MQHSTEENELLVASVYDTALKYGDNLSKMTEVQRVVFLVEHLMQEVNSGASFEQYFRWASIQELKSIVPTLQQLGLDDVVLIVERGLSIAFPRGIPRSEDEKQDLTEWSEEQEQLLDELFEPLEDLYYKVVNVLGEYARKSGA